MEVDFEDLEYLDSCIHAYGGKPFTGTAVEWFEDGEPRCRVSFAEGRECGVARDYFRNGQTQSETCYQAGLKHGLERDWNEEGELTRESRFEFDVLMSNKISMGTGQLVTEFVRDPSDPLAVLVRKRKAGGADFAD